MEVMVFLNGKFIDMKEAVVSVEDRGFQFGDGVYEVIRCYRGQPFCFEDHFERLQRSAAAIRLEVPYDQEELREIAGKLLDRVDWEEADIYLQLTRGYARRMHQFPREVKPTFVMYVRRGKTYSPQVRERGIKAIIVPDTRWALCYIKSTNLLPNVLARQEAEEQGAEEALFEREGIGVVEGSASNLFAVIDGVLITGPPSNFTLPGVTRDRVLKLAEARGIVTELRFLQREELLQADEVFVTSTTKEVLGVRQIDDQVIRDGKPGPITKALAQDYHQMIQRACG